MRKAQMKNNDGFCPGHIHISQGLLKIVCSRGQCIQTSNVALIKHHFKDVLKMQSLKLMHVSHVQVMKRTSYVWAIIFGLLSPPFITTEG